MYSFGLTIIVVATLIVLLICLICYSVYKERMDVVEHAKSMRTGDLYKKVMAKPKNPFIEPIVRYAKVMDVKFDASGEPWVSYCKTVGTSCLYYDKVRHFLSEYQYVDKEETIVDYRKEMEENK